MTLSNSVCRRWVRNAGLTAFFVTAAALAFAQEDAEQNAVRDTLSRPLFSEHQEAVAAAADRGGEVLEFEWQLRGFLGAIASLFVPSRGDAVLTFVPDSGDSMEVQMLVTSPDNEDAYFLYGAAMGEQDGYTSTIWSSYEYRDRRRDREQDINEPNVIDFASAMYLVRKHPPDMPQRMTLWNHGRTYAAEVKPLGVQRREVNEERKELFGFAVVGVRARGESYFDDNFYMYFDDNGTLTQIVARRGLMRVRMDLVRARSPDLSIPGPGPVVDGSQTDAARRAAGGPQSVTWREDSE